MSRRAVVLASVLFGCQPGSEGIIASDAGADDAQGDEADVRPYPARARVHAARQLLRGPPLARSQLEGVFPPTWHQGDEWRVLVYEERISQLDNHHYVEKKEFLFRVLNEPADEDGEYVIEALRYRLTEGSYLLTFSARDFSLIAIRATDGVHAGRVMGNGPHAFVQHELRGAVVAFPVVPLGLANPLVYPYLGNGRKMVSAQHIRPIEEGLSFDLETDWFALDDTGEIDNSTNCRWVQLEWRRGDPWWSSAISGDAPYLYGKLEGAVLENGHIILGRLLRGDELGEPPCSRTSGSRVYRCHAEELWPIHDP